MSRCQFIYKCHTRGVYQVDDQCKEVGVSAYGTLCKRHSNRKILSEGVDIREDQYVPTTRRDCQFIYRRVRGGYAAGDQCTEVGASGRNTLCHRHRKIGQSQDSKDVTEGVHAVTSDVDNSFPRVMADVELRACVNEARKRTSPEHMAMRVCIICGQLCVARDLIYQTAKDVLRSRDLLQAGDYYNRIPSQHFMYAGAHQELNGLVIDRSGFMTEEEVLEGAPLMVHLCKACDGSLLKGKVPDLALVNGLWTGVGDVAELNGLSWIEEKLIARCHVSIQIQKCREVRQWHVDGFRSQRKLKGNISTFPVSPSVILNRLPLSGGDMTGLVKVVFMSSRRRITLQEACRMRFFIVRRQKVGRALRWLIAHNPLYEEVEVCEETLASLPWNGIPLEIYESITFCDKVVQDLMGHSRYDQEDDEEVSHEENSDMSADVMEDVQANDCKRASHLKALDENLVEIMDFEYEDEERTSSYGSTPNACSHRFQNSSNPVESVMQCCGIIDVEGTTVSNEAKVFQALQGIYIPHLKDQHRLLPEEFPTHLYQVPLGQRQDDLIELTHGDIGFSNEYDIDHLMNAFPTLYPYGIGAPGAVKPGAVVSYERQVTTQLLQSHRLYSRHEVYIFVVFNIIQRRKICLGAKLYTKQSSLLEVRGLLQKVDYEEAHNRLTVDITSGKKHSFTDPLLNQLMQATSIANGMVRGSREYVMKRRSELMGLFISNGAPTFFVTINPDDLKHPLMISIWSTATGTQMDVPMRDSFIQYHHKRLRIISEDPVLQALFFDVIMNAVIDVLFGFDKNPKIGILGEVSAHYDIIEAQGKGTLHAHGMIWMKDVMNPKDVQRKMLDPEFRDRMIVYLEKVIKLDFDWADLPDEIEIHGKAQWEHPSYQFPNYDLDEDGALISDEGWMARFSYDAKSIATLTETHKHTGTCRKKGTVCRFGFGGSGKALVEMTTIDAESGRIDMKRGNARANNHNPAIAAVTRSNHDIKMTFASGYKSLQSLYYMTSYTSKFEDDTSDILAMDSAFKALEKEGLLSVIHRKERIRRLIIRMNYIRQGSLQFSGAQVAGMLLNIGREGTHYTNSTFCRLNLYAFINHVQKALGDFRVQLTVHDTTVADNEVEEDSEGMNQVTQCEEEEVEPNIGPIWKLSRPIEDYIYRGHRLNNYSLYELHQKTECVSTSVKEKEKYVDSVRERGIPAGRRRNERIEFQPQHSCESSQWMMMRTKATVPCILGIPLTIN